MSTHVCLRFVNVFLESFSALLQNFAVICLSSGLRIIRIPSGQLGLSNLNDIYAELRYDKYVLGLAFHIFRTSEKREGRPDRWALLLFTVASSAGLAFVFEEFMVRGGW